MPSRTVAIPIVYTAFNTSTQAGQTGDGANHTVKLVKTNGGTVVVASPANAPVEIDSTNAPGQYYVLLTTAEATNDSVQLVGKSSTAGVVLTASAVSFEQLPTATAGSASGLAVLNASGNVPADVQTIKSQTVTATAAFSFDAQTTAQTNVAGIASHSILVWADDAAGNGLATSTNLANLTTTVNNIASGVTVISANAVMLGGHGISTSGTVTFAVGTVSTFAGGPVASVTGPVTVGGYSSGEDPATIVWGAAARTITGGSLTTPPPTANQNAAAVLAGFLFDGSGFVKANVQVLPSPAPAGYGPSSGTGAYTYTITAQDPSGNLLQNVAVSFTSGITQLQGVTNSSGVVSFNANAGNWAVAAAAPGYAYPGSIVPVTANGDTAITLTLVVPPANPQPGQVAGWLYTQLPGTTITYQMVSPPPGMGSEFTGATQYGVSDSSGYWVGIFYQGASYSIQSGDAGTPVTFTAPTSGTQFSVLNLLGA